MSRPRSLIKREYHRVHLICVLESKGINPDSIRITSEGPRALVEFEPPNSQFYSRIVLRICLFSSTSSSAQTASSPKSGHPSRPSKDLVFLRPVQDARGGPSVGSASADSVASSTPAVDECSDYEVTFVELGFLQVELDRPVADYTFQFLVFRDTQLSQITRQLRLTNGRFKLWGITHAIMGLNQWDAPTHGKVDIILGD